jgi:hypothetical protein
MLQLKKLHFIRILNHQTCLICKKHKNKKTTRLRGFLPTPWIHLKGAVGAPMFVKSMSSNIGFRVQRLGDQRLYPTNRYDPKC